MAKLRKTLPKDFEELLKGSFKAQTAVLEACAIDARGSFGKRTALHYNCSAKLTRWLVERGADIEAEDTWGNAPLHTRITYRGDIDVLLELGANIEHMSRSLGTPLHDAVDSGARIDAVTKLLDRGAKVDAKNRDGRTPLELGLARCSNIEIPGIVATAKLLIDHGAKITPACKKSVTRIGEEFEFHRANFNKGSVGKYSKALDELYVLIGVEPVPRRVMHGGGRIVVKATTWQKQHAELWDLLIPSMGAAETVQGEVVRIAGRIGDELRRNGGGNWDKDYRAMANAYLRHVASGEPLSEADRRAATEVVRALPDLFCEFNELARLGVKWVLANPDPVKLPKPGYRR